MHGGYSPSPQSAALFLSLLQCPDAPDDNGRRAPVRRRVEDAGRAITQQKGYIVRMRDIGANTSLAEEALAVLQTMHVRFGRKRTS